MPSYLTITTQTNPADLSTQLANHMVLPVARFSIVNEPNSPVTIDQVRTLVGSTHFATNSSQRATNWLLRNLHASSIPAQNALLKFLEEPPDQVNIFAVATSLEGVLPTILSRCILIKLPTSQLLEQSITEYNPSDLYDEICQGNIPDLIMLAEKLSTSELSKDILRPLIMWLHHHPYFPSAKISKQLQLLNQANAALFANANLRLTLEHCFFEINKSQLYTT